MEMRFKKTITTAARIAILPALLMSVAACSPVKFDTKTTSNDPGVTTNTATPTPTPTPPVCNVETIYRKTKILFVVDASGSNVENDYNNINGQNIQFPASDPVKNFRGGAINTFFTNYQHKANFSWSFETFQGSSAYAYINGFSSDTTVMSSAIQRFYNQVDQGQTPYGAALATAKNMIGNDPDLNSADQPNYYVIFLSDGFPTDYTTNGVFNSAQMRSDVAALVAKAPGRVTLSTVYYAASQQTIPSAISDLQQMATAGGGQFANVNTSSNTFTIDDVIGSKQNCN